MTLLFDPTAKADFNPVPKIDTSEYTFPRIRNPPGPAKFLGMAKPPQVAPPSERKRGRPRRLAPRGSRADQSAEEAAKQRTEELRRVVKDPTMRELLATALAIEKKHTREFESRQAALEEPYIPQPPGTEQIPEAPTHTPSPPSSSPPSTSRRGSNNTSAREGTAALPFPPEPLLPPAKPPGSSFAYSPCSFARPPLPCSPTATDHSDGLRVPSTARSPSTTEITGLLEGGHPRVRSLSEDFRSGPIRSFSSNCSQLRSPKGSMRSLTRGRGGRGPQKGPTNRQKADQFKAQCDAVLEDFEKEWERRLRESDGAPDIEAPEETQVRIEPKKKGGIPLYTNMHPLSELRLPGAVDLPEELRHRAMMIPVQGRGEGTPGDQGWEVVPVEIAKALPGTGMSLEEVPAILRGANPMDGSIGKLKGKEGDTSPPTSMRSNQLGEPGSSQRAAKSIQLLMDPQARKKGKIEELLRGPDEEELELDWYKHAERHSPILGGIWSLDDSDDDDDYEGPPARKSPERQPSPPRPVSKPTTRQQPPPPLEPPAPAEEEPPCHDSTMLLEELKRHQQEAVRILEERGLI